MHLCFVHTCLWIIGLHLQNRLSADVVLCAHSWDQVNEEGENVEGEDEGDGPFEDGRCVEIVFFTLHTECLI